MKRKTLYQLFIHGFLLLSVFIIAFPVLYALVTSTLSFSDAFSFPPKLLPGRHFLENAAEAWNRVHMGRLMFNSTVVSVSVAVVKIILSMRAFGWIDTYWALTVPFFASTTGILLFRQFFLTVPRDLSDAARVDGAGPWRYFLQILVPISRTNIAALFVIEFIFMWSQYLWPLIVTNSREMRVVQIGLKMLLASEQQAPEWNVIMAGTVIAMLPPLIVLILFRRSFAQGIAMQTEK